jgi:DNA modification methylase
MDTEIGREGDPDSYVIALTEVFDAAYQVLRDDGTLWLNLGDKWHNGQMMGLPWRVAFALKAYGWILRADCIWAKKNVMPSSVQNRCTYSHEHMFMFTKKPAGYFYDSVAIQEPMISGAGTKNKRDVWLLATQPVSEPHYATFPTWLVEPCILAGTSEKGCCMNCGAPLIREFTTAKITRDRPNATTTRHMQDAKVNSCENTVAGTAVTTAGWKPSCQCIGTDTRPCTVLDLFGGSGTVSIVAETHKRSSVLIDLDEANAGIASRRLKAKTNYELEIIS